MKKKQFPISLIFISVFSFLGGIVGGVICSGKPIFAEALKAEGIKWKPAKITKRIDYLESNIIYAKSLVIRHILIKNEDDQPIGEISNLNGNPYIKLFNKLNPMGTSEGASFSLGLGEDGTPKMLFRDKDLDDRIILGVYGLDPTMTIYYNHKTRLQLGTNYLKHPKTGNEEKVKGSVCAFDNNGSLIGRLPYN
jgi:hypothetical protein